MTTPDPENIVRPRLNWHGQPLHERTSYAFNGVLVERYGRRIHLLGRDWPVETADGVGRVLIELAEAAAAEPDAELLGELKEAVFHSQDASVDHDEAERIARDILARFDVAKKRGTS